MGHVGGTVANDLAFHAIVPVWIVRHIILHSERLSCVHEWSQLQILCPHRCTWTPTGTVINPGSSLRIKWIVRALLHDFPTPLQVVIDLHAVRVVAKLTTVVPLSKIVATCPCFQSPHFFTVARIVGLRKDGFIPIVEVVKSFPKCFDILDISRWCSFDECEFEIQQFLPIATLQFDAVLQEGRVIGHIEHPSPSVRPEGQVDSVRRNVPGELYPIDDLKWCRPIIQNVVVVIHLLSQNVVRREGVSVDRKFDHLLTLSPTIMQVCPFNIVAHNFPLRHRHRRNLHSFCPVNALDGS